MRVLICAEIMVICTIATGCATYGELDKDYGKSFNLATSNQIRNPAAANVTPVEGLVGAAVQENMNKYVQSFSRSTAAPAQNSNSGKEK